MAPTYDNPMTNDGRGAQRRRDQALGSISRATRWMVAGAAGSAALLTGVLAHEIPGHAGHTSTSTRSGASSSSTSNRSEGSNDSSGTTGSTGSTGSTGATGTSGTSGSSSSGVSGGSSQAPIAVSGGS